MLDETHVDMLRADAALAGAYATIEQLRQELDAMRRAAGDLADEKGRIATELLETRLKLDTAFHNATHMTAKVAEIDTERLALLDALQRYVDGDGCEYADDPPECPGDVSEGIAYVVECRWHQAMRALKGNDNAM